jgi:heme-degrading monooxygenase HmoA
MILEFAVISIAPAQKQAFETAFTEARKIISLMPGFISHQLQRCVETDGRYLLLVQWQTIEHHTRGFRESPQFQRWRALVGPFFAASPVVEHHELVSSGEAA